MAELTRIEYPCGCIAHIYDLGDDEVDLCVQHQEELNTHVQAKDALDRISREMDRHAQKVGPGVFWDPPPEVSEPEDPVSGSDHTPGPFE